jgi:hypothetical protein
VNFHAVEKGSKKGHQIHFRKERREEKRENRERKERTTQSIRRTAMSDSESDTNSDIHDRGSERDEERTHCCFIPNSDGIGNEDEIVAQLLTVATASVSQFPLWARAVHELGNIPGDLPDWANSPGEDPWDLLVMRDRNIHTTYIDTVMDGEAGVHLMAEAAHDEGGGDRRHHGG